MSKLRIAELEGGRRFGECSSKKTIGSRYPVLLAPVPGSVLSVVGVPLSVSRFHRFYHPSVTTGIGALNLWKVNKNHRMRTVECR